MKVAAVDIDPSVVVIDDSVINAGKDMEEHDGPVHWLNLQTDSYVFCFTGRRGGGKTTLMTLFCVKAAKVDRDLRIISNYPIEFYIRRSEEHDHLDHYRSETLDFEKLFNFSDDYQGVLICIDEAPDIISHLASMTWKNRLLAAFVRQLRKNRNSLFLAAQDFNLIDNSMRWQTDIMIQCADLSKIVGESNELERGEAILFKMFDQSGLWTGKSTEERIAEMKHAYRDAPDHAYVKKGVAYPRLLWGDKEAGTKPVFDTYYQMDVFESLKRVDMKLSSYKIGDGQPAQQEEKYPVSGKALARALELITPLVTGENKLCYQKEFWEAFGPVTDKDKDSLSKQLSQFGIGRSSDSSTNKRVYSFEDFNIEGFRAYVEATKQT